MPTYDYRCAKCGDELEVFQTFAEKPLVKHAGCGGKLAKVLSPAGIVLKGSGFYKTDNRSSTRSGGGESDNGSSKSGENGSSSGSSESSSDSKSSDSGKSESGKSGSEKSGSGKSDAGSSSSNGSSSKPAKPAAKSA
jgi:putative FmdB family regulatory protein